MRGGPRLAIALVSAAALAYEVVLMRLFAIIQWHHFAYMIISIALLGYGVSGTFLTLWRPALLARFPAAFLTNILLFALSVPLAFLLAQRLPFNPLELLWDRMQPLWLLANYLLLTLPFFFAANAIGLALSRYPGQSSRLYALDLSGAAIGSVAVIVLLFLLPPQAVPLLLSGALFLTAAVAWWELGRGRRSLAALFLLPLPLLAVVPADWIAPQLSPYKGMSQLLQVSGTRLIDSRSSPLGLLSVVESGKIPLRYAPGLSLLASGEPPPQLALFSDGEGMAALNRQSGRERLAYLDQMSSALPYHLRPIDHALILGAGAGSDLLQARYNRVGRIDAVELNPQVAALQQEYAGFTGDPFSLPGVTLHLAEGRGFIAQAAERYELIQIALLDSFSASSAGLYALSESYLYTVEALGDYLRHLTPEGMVAISRWVKLPPRDTLKLFATAIAALQRLGVEEPGDHLALIRSWQTSTLVIKRAPFTVQEVEALRAFCRARAFDPVYYPGIAPGEANRYNQLREPLFYQGTQALLGGEAQRFMAHYKFNLEPASDDSPYFFHFFKWAALAEIGRLLDRGGMGLLEMGYLVLVATLLQAVLASGVLILLPLWLGRRRVGEGAPQRLRPLAYFFLIGLAFLFIEIAFIQKFILFLHHPLYAISVVLAAFLLFAGLGSRFSSRYGDTPASAGAIRRAVAGIALLGLLYLLLLDPLFALLLHLPYALKIAIAVGLIAPLAFCMGIPFPLGLARLGETAPSLVPWVWGVNGCASVVSAVTAVLLAIHFGFSAVIVTAVLLYLLAATVVPGSGGGSLDEGIDGQGGRAATAGMER